jgi:hypothetical protein
MTEELANELANTVAFSVDRIADALHGDEYAGGPESVSEAIQTPASGSQTSLARPPVSAADRPVAGQPGALPGNIEGG